jgi:hypothetical protein
MKAAEDALVRSRHSLVFTTMVALGPTRRWRFDAIGRMPRAGTRHTRASACHAPFEAATAPTARAQPARVLARRAKVIWGAWASSGLMISSSIAKIRGVVEARLEGVAAPATRRRGALRSARRALRI